MKKRFLLFLVFFLPLLSSCSLPGLSTSSTEDSVVVVGQTTTESQILTYVIQGMIEHYTELNAEVIVNMGSTTMAQQAMLQEDADIASSMYTGSVINGILGYEEVPRDPKEALDLVTREVDERLNQKWYPSWGFANTYAFMVRPDTKEEYKLEMVSDLKDHAGELVAGVDQAWISKDGDGYQAFIDHYGFDFGDIYPMDIGLAYDALDSGQVDVILGYSTDGRIASYDLQLLEDDQHFFPSYEASPTANHAVLEDYPILDDILLKLHNSVSDQVMQELNFKSDDFLLEPSTVAQQFLKEHNYFEDVEPYLEVKGAEN